MGRRPTPIRVLDAINEFADWSGNVPYDHLSWRFCARGGFTADGLNAVLDELKERSSSFATGQPTTASTMR